MQENHIQDFLQRFAQNSHTEDEHRQFIDWLANADLSEVEKIAGQYRVLAEKTREGATNTSSGSTAGGMNPVDPENESAERDMLVREIERAIDESEMQRRLHPVTFSHGLWMGAAAVLLVLLGTMAWLLWYRPVDPAMAGRLPVAPAGDVLPGSDKAVLVLADGTEVSLGRGKVRKIVEKNGHAIEIRTASYPMPVMAGRAAPARHPPRAATWPLTRSGYPVKDNIIWCCRMAPRCG